jgi:hypothetical protein
MQYASYGSITFFGRESMTSFNLTFSGSGSPKMVQLELQQLAEL